VITIKERSERMKITERSSAGYRRSEFGTAGWRFEGCRLSDGL